MANTKRHLFKNRSNQTGPGPEGGLFTNRNYIGRCTAAILIVLGSWLATEVLPGSGVQRFLDLRGGTSSDAFIASLQKAENGMTLGQVEAFEWATRNLTDEQLIARYGSSATVREVVVGETLRYVDKQRTIINHLEGTVSHQDLDAEQNRKEAVLTRLKTIVPVIRSIQVFGFNENSERDCNSGGCQTDDVESSGMLVLYSISNPNRVALKQLPCTVIYRSNGRMTKQERDFNCLTQEKAPNGDYYLWLPLKSNKTDSKMEASILVSYEDATVQDPEVYFRQIPALGVSGDFRRLIRAKSEMKKALDYKSMM